MIYLYIYVYMYTYICIYIFIYMNIICINLDIYMTLFLPAFSYVCLTVITSDSVHPQAEVYWLTRVGSVL
jgi:hypothetical protein